MRRSQDSCVERLWVFVISLLGWTKRCPLTFWCGGTGSGEAGRVRHKGQSDPLQLRHRKHGGHLAGPAAGPGQDLSASCSAVSAPA